MFFVSCGLPKIDHDYFPTGTCILGFWGCNSISHWLSLTDRNCYELDKELQDRTSWNNWNVLAHHCLYWISSLGLSQWVDLVPCVTQELRYKMLCNTLSVILLPASSSSWPVARVGHWHAKKLPISESVQSWVSFREFQRSVSSWRSFSKNLSEL